MHSWRPSRRLIVATLLLALAILWVGCYPSNPQSTFDAAGPVAQKQLNLFLIIFWAAVFVFVVVQGALVYTVIRFRRRPRQDIPKQVHGNTRLEVAWTIAPTLVLIVIAVPTITTIFDTANIPDQENVLEVKVTGHQWWWEFEYPQLGLVTANELHVPPDPWVIDVTLESDDVIHSFWIPKLAGKVDVIPNNVNTLWFRADEPGEYFGQCTEFCGIAHAQMRFRVIVEPTKEAFDDWVEGQLAPAAVSMAPVFGLKACGVCHTVTGPDPEGMQDARMDAFLAGQPTYPAPNLTHFASRGTFAGGILERTDDNLRRWLKRPFDVKPGNHMAALAGVYTNPNLALVDDDIDALLAYLQSLK